MQITVYFNKDRAKDKELLERLREKAEEERRSKSATVLTILEEYFRAEEQGDGGNGTGDQEGEEGEAESKKRIKL